MSDRQVSGVEMVPDAALVRRVLDGDASAFTVLADRHAPAALRFATRMLGSRDDAEEVAQDALVRAYRALHSFDDRKTFRTWLFAILVNRCRSALKSRALRQRWVRSDESALQRTTVPGHERDTELRVEIARAIGVLPSDQREAFLLKYVEQLEYTEMAEITGSGVSALKMRVQRACTRLKQELRDYSAEFGDQSNA